MKKIICIFISFIFCLGLFAQKTLLGDYVIRQWNSSDGLTGNSITDIIQAQSGYIYIGTYDGLVRFDGFDFTTFTKTNDEKYKFLSARSVMEDSSNRLWVGSNDEGVQMLDKNTSLSFTTQNGLPNNSVRSIIEDKNQNIWIGTAGGVVYIDKELKINIPQGLEAPDSKYLLINNIYCDTAGRIWIMAEGMYGAKYYSGGSFHSYSELDDYSENMISAIGQDKSGSFWFGLDTPEIVRVVDGVAQKVTTNTLLDSTRTNCIFTDSSGSIWFGTEKGLILFREGRYFDFTSHDLLGENSINKIMEDREGNIWIATSTAGIQKLSLGKFQTKKTPSTVNAIMEAPDGKVWIACDDGLLCYSDGDFIQNELTDFCKGLRIRHLGLAKNNDLFVNCYTKPGFIRYNGSEMECYNTDNGLAGNKTRIALEVADGSIYVGTTTGLSVINPDGEIVNYHRAEGIENEFIMWLYEASDGFLWVGTDGGGIFLMKDGLVVDKLTTSQGLSGNVVFKICRDQKGVYWISTGSGVSRIEKQDNKSFVEDSSLKITNYTSLQGLGTDSIFQILFDYTGTAWMLSNRGICAVPYSDLTNLAEGKITHVDAKYYNQNDGLITKGIASTALSMVDHFGRVWFTLVDGFSIYDPVKVTSSNVLPIVHIESVKVDNENVDFSGGQLILAPGTKRVEIKYTGLSFSAPERTRFTYFLDGFDSDYNELSSSKIATYTRLKPGKYIFNVNAMNADGKYSESPESLILIQKPFLYQRISFWIIVGIIIVMAVYLIIYSIIRKNKVQQLKLETMVQMKTVDLEIEKDKSDRLLRNILPASIAEQLKSVNGPDGRTIAERFENVTVLFSDLVGFTDMTSREKPEDIVSSLNNLISRFDIRAEKMGIEKIKTIGDAYMAACGVPVPDENHAEKIVAFAKGMYKDLENYNRNARIKFQMRIGINSGTVIAGVIGKNKFIYDMWGDTVNVASRMESTCTPGRIRITQSVKEILEQKYTINSCVENECNIKGKGIMKTYEI
ncbi:MAG: hypothetical protein K6G09_02150 [Treponema sp.]|nr:hypothetical protein [Treponema sp.]